MADDFRTIVGWRGHPKRKKLRRRLGADAVLAIEDLREFCAESRPDGSLAGLSNEDLAITVDYPGDPDALVEVLLEVRLLDGEPGDLRIHDWAEHQPWVSEEPIRRRRARRAANAKHHSLHDEHVEDCPRCEEERAEQAPASTGTAQAQGERACTVPKVSTSTAQAPTTPACAVPQPDQPDQPANQPDQPDQADPAPSAAGAEVADASSDRLPRDRSVSSATPQGPRVVTDAAEVTAACRAAGWNVPDSAAKKVAERALPLAWVQEAAGIAARKQGVVDRGGYFVRTAEGMKRERPAPGSEHERARRREDAERAPAKTMGRGHTRAPPTHEEEPFTTGRDAIRKALAEAAPGILDDAEGAA